MSRTILQNSGVIYNNSNDSGNIVHSYNNEFNRCNVFISDDKRQVLEWLSPLASRERHQSVRDTRVEGVGDWLLRTESFSTWRLSEGRAAKPVLLCCGDPGVGKTYISSLVIDTLCSEISGDDVAVAYVYCDFSARGMQSASAVLGSVLRQIVGALAEIPDEVQKAFQSAKRQVDSCGLRLPEILEMLIGSLSRLHKGVICIDALDEFPTNHRAQLWDSLQRVVRECPKTRLFLTGRPHVGTEAVNYFPESADVVPVTPALSDIGIYIEGRLKGDLDLNAMDNELRADILRVIPKKISGIFLLVCICMDAIMAETTIHRRRQALHRMTNGLGLRDGYNTTLDRIRQQGESRSRLAMEALMWVSYCERPLKSGELCHALGVELGAEDFNAQNVPPIQTVLGCTLGLVTIDERLSTVRLLHFTLHEYLGQHHTLFVTAHSMMAEICLTYLNYRSVKALPPNFNTALAGASLLEYATCFWGAHAASEAAEPVTSLAVQLMEGYENHVSAAIFWRDKINGWCFVNDVEGISGLHCIAYWGIAEIATVMLRMKAWDLNARDSWGDTPLMWAVNCRNNNIVELLLGQEDIKPNVDISGGRTVLSFAAESGNEGAVKLLLERRDVDPNSSDSDGRTPLSFAVSEGHKGIVKLLLERGDVNPNSSDRDGRTPLLVATMSKQEGIVKLLLERWGVDPNLSDNCGRTPLSYAASRGYEGVRKVVQECMNVDLNLPGGDGLTPLFAATIRNEQDLVKLLLERVDVDPNSPDSGGQTPLIYAARRGYWHVAKLLLERGDVNPNSSDSDGRTPLSFAVSEGHMGIVKLLLERVDVDPNLPASDGRTPLGYAGQNQFWDVARLLLERWDVNPDSRNHMGKTLLSFAASAGQEGLVKLLLGRADVNPDSRDNEGRTPLSYAAFSGYESVVKLLLGRADVNPDSRDNEGRTPLPYAAFRGYEGVVKLLLGRGDVNPDSCDNMA